MASPCNLAYRALLQKEQQWSFSASWNLRVLRNLSSRVYLMISTIMSQESHSSRLQQQLAITNPTVAVGFIANSEKVLTRGAVLGRGAATTNSRKFFALTEAAKDRPFRKLFNA